MDLLLAAAGLVGMAASGCYYIYRSKDNDAKMLQLVKYVNFDKDLASQLAAGKSIDYAAVKGKIYPENQFFQGRFSASIFGFIFNLIVRRYNGPSQSWFDQDKLIPFRLITDDGTPLSIRIVDAKYANRLTLEAFYEQHEPVDGSNVVEYLVDWFRDKLNAIGAIEKVLKAGTTITGVGQIVISSDGELQLQPPMAGGYYLTRDGLGTLAERVSLQAKTMLYICIALAIAASVIGLYALKKRHQRAAKEQMKIAAEERMTRERERNTAEERARLAQRIRQLQDAIDESLCVICLVNARNVVLFECRHLCVCNACVQRLAICPVCRGPINRTDIVYHS